MIELVFIRGILSLKELGTLFKCLSRVFFQITFNGLVLVEDPFEVLDCHVGREGCGSKELFDTLSSGVDEDAREVIIREVWDTKSGDTFDELCLRKLEGQLIQETVDEGADHDALFVEMKYDHYSLSCLVNFLYKVLASDLLYLSKPGPQLRCLHLNQSLFPVLPKDLFVILVQFVFFDSGRFENCFLILLVFGGRILDPELN